MRESKDQVQVIGNFNSESTYLPIGTSEPQSILQTCGRGYYVVAVLGAGQEPTNHALRDIAALSGEFEKWGRKMVLLFPSEQKVPPVRIPRIAFNHYLWYRRRWSDPETNCRIDEVAKQHHPAHVYYR